MSSLPTVLLWLRATAEPTRLRLLALCAARDLSVSDLAQVLGQSEPRVSRHLRILTEAGLVERLRQGQWVHYRLSRATAAGQFAQGLLGQLDRTDPALARDLQRAHAANGAPAPAPGQTASRLVRELRAVCEAELAERPASMLWVGLEHPELLVSVARLGTDCTAIAHSRRSAQAARALLERDRLSSRIVQAVGTELFGALDLQRLGGPFDAVLIDHLAAKDPIGTSALVRAREVLRAEGRLWLFERYPAGQTERVVEHPIARLRRVLAEGGFDCQRIRPIEADGQHVLAAAAVLRHSSLTLSCTA